MLTNLKKKKKGFTLIELIIVIAIIAILAALAIPKFGEVRKNANIKSDIANAKTIATATSALLADGTITASTTAIDLSVTTANTDSSKIRDYLQTVPNPKVATGNFVVETEDNNVIVYIAAPATGSNTLTLNESNQVYPEPTVSGAKGSNSWYPELGTTPTK